MRFSYRFGLAAAALFGAALPALSSDAADPVAVGEEVFGRVCFECHNAVQPSPDMAAPPIFAAKNHYADLTDRAAFVEAVSAFLLAPSAETARMPGAIARFGVMPPPEVTEAEARAVAEYLFATDFSLPDWYLVHYQEEHGTAPAGN